ncbi:MAG: DNA-binding transcriptional regulator [Phenylobacterium sp.]|uniref:helix-turn-helix transcriptional regulator n=1 Tax=Phenylobacterium sp. TaxID=1871053 RepID=UPI0025FBBD9A|nr:WYL domain-containing protein [Phenylobacterium sp.]MBA4013144.1 DNA-binding transcriptional regulator [Phenylobacterium sp.]
MRHEKAARLLDLARMLASSAEGLTLDEMADRLGVGRRTAERMRDAVREAFPQLEEVDDPPTRRFRIPAGLDGIFQAPSADEFAALRAAAEQYKAAGARARAGALLSLEQKVLSAIRAGARRKLAPDLEALLEAETMAIHAGPRPFEDETVLGAVREAIISLRRLRLRYEGGSSPGRVREITPFGLLFGRSNYLVGGEGDSPEPRTWRLDRIRDIEVSETAGSRPAGFSLQAFINRSFGIYQDEVEEVVLRILPHGAEEAMGWRFHPTQSIEPQDGGSVLVRFTAGGMRELAWHLFTWGDKVEIIAPQRLRSVMREELAAAARAHGMKDI